MSVPDQEPAQLPQTALRGRFAFFGVSAWITRLKLEMHIFRTCILVPRQPLSTGRCLCCAGRRDKRSSLSGLSPDCSRSLSAEEPSTPPPRPRARLTHRLSSIEHGRCGKRGGDHVQRVAHHLAMPTEKWARARQMRRKSDVGGGAAVDPSAATATSFSPPTRDCGLHRRLRFARRSVDHRDRRPHSR